MSPAMLARLVGPPLAVVAVWAMVALVPAAFDSTEDDLLRAQDDALLLNTELTAARALPEKADEIGRMITAARIAVPDEVELAEFVRDVGAVGDRSGVDVEQLAPLTVAGDSDAESAIDLPADTSSVTLSIGASGTYEQVMAFATGLRGLDRLVVIDLIGLTVDEESSSSVIVDLELRIFTTAELTATSELDDQLLDGEEELDPAELIEDQP